MLRCPICSCMMKEEAVFGSQQGYDLLCRREDHLLVKRFTAMGDLISLKLRITDGTQKFFAQFDYKENTTSLWTKPNERHPIKVDCIISTDLSNLDKIKQKIKTYLLFS